MARTVQPILNMRNRVRRPVPAGFTLVELMIVVIIIGIMTAYALPRAGKIYDRTMVRGARGAITNLYNASRAAARASNHTMVLRRTGNVMTIEQQAFGSTSTTITGGYKDLGSQYKVTLSGPATILVNSRGMLTSSGTTYTWVITRNGYSDSVMVDSYGRVLR